MISGMVSSVNGKVDTSGTNLAVDSDAQFADAGTIRNIAIGTDALDSTTDAATENIAIGINALTALTTGDYNVAIGGNAGGALDTSGGNVAVGYNALTALNTTGIYNTAIGYTAMDAVTSSAADYNIAIGFEALAGGANTTANNVAIGRQAFNHVNSAASGVVSIGYGTCQGNATGDADGTVAVGINALQQLTSGIGNVAVGSTAGSQITTADHCIAIGKQAMAVHTVGVRNIAIGHQAMLDTNATAAVGGGTGSTPGTLASADNIFIGFQSGGGIWDDEDSNFNVAIGNYTMDAAMDGVTHTVAVGYNAGSAITSASYNTLLGSRAGLSLTTGADNVVVGNAAMSSPLTAAATACVAVGGNAMGGTHANNATNYTVAVGNNALGGACDGASYSTAIGYAAGDTITTGNHNILMGFHAEASAATVTYEIVIGSGVDISNAFVGGGTDTVRIGRAAEYMTMDLTGSTAGAWVHGSDIRIKKDVQDCSLGLGFINDLRTVTYKKKALSEYPEEFNAYNADETEGSNKKHYGFIAQEVKEAMNKAGDSEFTMWSENSDGMQELAEGTLVMPLVKAVQELSQQVKDLQTKIGDA